MTKAQAMKYVRTVAAQLLRTEIDNGSGWIGLDDEGNDRPAEDVERIEQALEILAARLEPEPRS